MQTANRFRLRSVRRVLPIYCIDELSYGQRIEVAPTVIEKTMKYIREKYFAVENYLFSCGVSLKDMDLIRRKLVD